MQTTMTTHTIVPRDEWLAARAALHPPEEPRRARLWVAAAP